MEVHRFLSNWVREETKKLYEKKLLKVEKGKEFKENMFMQITGIITDVKQKYWLRLLLHNTQTTYIHQCTFTIPYYI